MAKSVYKQVLEDSYYLPKCEQKTSSIGINTNRSNVVSQEALQQVQLDTLRLLSNYLAKTFGPMGSNTKIITGNDENSILSEYSKDGHKVLKHIKFSNPIEMSIKSEIVEITHHVEQEVGDGTTSAVLLATKIFEGLLGIMEAGHYSPYKVIYAMNEVIKNIQEQILSKKRAVTIDDIYDICMISTNGNEEIAENIKNIYVEYGMDVQIDVSVSPNKESMLKTYDGLTLTEGYSDPAYINNTKDGTCELHNPSVYMFIDPIDTMDMVSLFEKIIVNNIIEPLNANEDMIPTVIVSPKMSGDMSALMKQVVDIMHQCDANQKPPLLVITNLLGSTDEEIALDIAELCGCKYIKKYIDPAIKKVDEEKGLAATLDNVADFGGKAELVVADVAKTKFVNPAKMFNEDGEHSDTYNGLINFLKAELANARANGEDDRSVFKMRKRLKSLEANMVEYFVGGISVADRDSVRDLVEDSVKSCASACEHGVGNAANYEGLEASLLITREYIMNDKNDDADYKLAAYISQVILEAYIEVATTLYSTVYVETDTINDIIEKSLEFGGPLNLRSDKFDKKVLTSIMTDVKILEGISKIVTIMVTSNQCLLQAPQLNTYDN